MPEEEPPPEWAFDLVHPDDGRRARALAAYHRRCVEAASAQRQANTVWLSEQEKGRPFTSSSAWQAAHAKSQRLYARTLEAWLPGARVRKGDARVTVDAVGVLFLQWESAFPGEYDSASHFSSRWSHKDLTLRRFRRG